MQSLYNLTENLLAIYDALEENGGELTDEFAATLPDYVKVTASISKTAIKEADFPEGVLPAGVTAVETQSITIR